MKIAPPRLWYPLRTQNPYYRGISGGSQLNGDPHWENVVLLAGNDSAADESTSFLDQSPLGHTLTATTGAKYDDANVPSGLSTWMFFNGSSRVLAPTHAGFTFGTGDFTIEYMMRFSALASNGNTLSMHPTIWNEPNIDMFIDADGSFGAWSNAHGVICNGGAGTIVINTTYHVAYTRASGSHRVFLNGSQLGSTYSGGSDNYGSGVFRLGENIDGSRHMTGWLGSFRVTKGVARYTAGFTAPSLPFPA